MTSAINRKCDEPGCEARAIIGRGEEWYDEDGRDVDEAFGSDARMNESEGIK